MPYNNKAKSNKSGQKTPYTHPPRTRKPEPCYCQACKGKSVDPRTKEVHEKNTIIPRREITANFSETLEIQLADLSSDPADINSNEELQESFEESYSFLV